MKAKNAGLTLVEVVAGMALLSTLLVTAILSFGRLDKQIRESERRIEACHQADALLEYWMGQTTVFPIGRSGTCDNGMVWKTRELKSTQIPSLQLSTVRVELYSANGEAGSNEPLVQVDVLLSRLDGNYR